MPNYCDIDEVENILSEDGVTNRTDDSPESVRADSEVTACIEQATSIINGYLSRRYSFSALATSTWIKWCCAYLSACRLAKRRANACPEPIAAECRQYLDWLKEIRDGVMDVPEIAPEVDMLPTVSNLTVDGRFTRQKVRRVPSTSTGSPPTPPVTQKDTVDFWPY